MTPPWGLLWLRPYFGFSACGSPAGRGSASGQGALPQAYGLDLESRARWVQALRGDYFSWSSPGRGQGCLLDVQVNTGTCFPLASISNLCVVRFVPLPLKRLSSVTCAWACVTEGRQGPDRKCEGGRGEWRRASYPRPPSRGPLESRLWPTLALWAERVCSDFVVSPASCQLLELGCAGIHRLGRASTFGGA